VGKHHKYSKEIQERKLARRLRGRQYLRMLAPPPSAAVACWSELTSPEGQTADLTAGESADEEQSAVGDVSQSADLPLGKAANQVEDESAGEESHRAGKSILVKPRGPVKGFFNRDKLEQFSFFAK
jgi:hypothetical protein